MASTVPQETRDLLAYIDASPTPYHCVAETARQLDAAGFTRLAEGEAWPVELGGAYYVARGGNVIAFRVGTKAPAEAGFRLLGAHTDSPNLRVKPEPDVRKAGYAGLAVETYGGILDYTWLDRDLGLAGRVAVAGEGGDRFETRLVDVRRPILRIPSLAIHLNRGYKDDGLKLNAQQHLPPMLGLAGAKDKDGPGALRRLVGEALGVDAGRVLSWDLALCDTVPCAVGGIDEELVFAPRLDNQASCHASLAALLAAGEAAVTQVIGLYDHEEVGSGSTEGADGPLMEWTLRRLAAAFAPERAETESLARAVSRSFQVSADMAHAVHPNYEDRHESGHKPMLNGGPVIKINVNQRYATSSEGAALFEALAREVEVPLQKFVNRTDLACGTTIGPITAAKLGIRTVDVGNPMLSMHSIREQAGTLDHPRMIAVMTRFLQG
ncbi:MAG: M18 family aminopeptidase [Myxococcales bacterium]|nr:M18 family aminopeptidase [Myxococcales bacterium]